MQSGTIVKQVDCMNHGRNECVRVARRHANDHQYRHSRHWGNRARALSSPFNYIPTEPLYIMMCTSIQYLCWLDETIKGDCAFLNYCSRSSSVVAGSSQSSQPARQFLVCSILSNKKAILNQWHEQIIRPLEIQYTQKEMERHEYHGPVKQNARLHDAIPCHATKEVHNERIQNHPNGNPTQIKSSGDNLLQWWIRLSFE